jgi:flagellar biosynthetic protein FlhB
VSQDRTEKATPKKRNDARKKGQVLKSSEVNTAVSLLGMFLILKVLAPYLGQRFQALMTKYLGSTYMYGQDSLHYDNLFRINIDLAIDGLLVLLPLLFGALLLGILVNFAQVGNLFTTEPLKPKLSKISLISGFKRMFSLKAITELAKSTLKVVILGKIVYDEYVSDIVSIPLMMSLPLEVAIARIVDAILMIGIKAGIGMLIIAILDYAYQWWQYEKDLRMSKQEVKDEYTQMEGDPKVKGRIKQKQRELGMMRMMQAVPDADVVITNPTHYAVALQYAEGEMSAPKVVAKGQDLVAMRIREIAAKNGVEIVENRPVAQSLFFFCEVGDMIPENMYQAVAEILAAVYRARRSA